jgi:hypothetical protein
MCLSSDLLIEGKFRANAKPYFMVSWTSSTIKLVHETIKYGLAPLEVGPEFALKLGFVN